MSTLPARISRRSPLARRSLVSCALLPFLLLAAERAPAGWVETQKLYGVDTDAGDRFGKSLAVDGATAIVGAEDKGEPILFGGAAYVFERKEGEQWAQAVRLQPTNIEFGDNFGIWVCLDGDTAIVHAFVELSEGKIYIFDRDRGGADQWGQVTWFTAPDGSTTFGSSCALSGDTLAIGDAFSDDVAGDGGAVYLFERHAGGTDQWGWVDKLYAPDPAVDARFGGGLAVDGNRMLVGAPTLNEAGLFDSGAAYIFEQDDEGQWKPVAKLTPSAPQDEDRFGQRVALKGDTAVLGSHSVHGDKGAIWVFERSDAGFWVQVARLQAEDGESNDEMASSLDFSDGVIVAGAPGDDTGCLGAGAVYVFERDGAGEWAQSAKLLASDVECTSAFSDSVGVSQGTILTGDRWRDDLGDDAGTVYVFTPELASRLLLRLRSSTVAPGEPLRFAMLVEYNGVDAVTVPVHVWAVDAAGEIVARFTTAPRTMEPGDRLSGHYQVTIPLETPPGTYELRVGVGEAENRIAGDRVELEVVAAP